MSLNKRNLQQTILNRSGHISIPNELLKALTGEPTAFMVWTYIYGQAEDWQPSLKQIETALNLGHTTIIRAISLLEEKKLLIVHSGSYCQKNDYELTDISTWNISSCEMQQAPR